MIRLLLLLVVFSFVASIAWSASVAAGAVHASAKVAGPTTDEATGVQTFKIRSAFTGGENHLDVLLPDDYDESRQYRVLFVLPVMPGTSTQFGDGLEQLRKKNLHNHHDLILARPRFDTTPWFGNHASDPSIQHERYMNEVVVPLIDRAFSTLGNKEGRLLIGYSKSGWGALSLILRNPDIYGYAAAWDNPLAIPFGHFGTGKHYGTEAQFEKFSPLKLIAQIGAKRAGLTDRPRIALLGKSLFGKWTGGGQGNPDVDDTQAGRAALLEAGIAHFYSDQMKSSHHWDSMWVRPAVELLDAMSHRGEPRDGVYFEADFDASSSPYPSGAALHAGTSVGRWTGLRGFNSRLVADADGEDRSLRMAGSGGQNAMFVLHPAAPMPRDKPLRFAFDVATRGGYGKDPATQGHGGNRNYIITARDAHSRPIFRAVIIGLTKQGRVGYLDASGKLHVAGGSITRNNTDTYDPGAMHRMQIVLREATYDLFLDGKKVAGDLPLHEGATAADAVDHVLIEGTNYAAKAYCDNFTFSIDAK